MSIGDYSFNFGQPTELNISTGYQGIGSPIIEGGAQPFHIQDSFSSNPLYRIGGPDQKAQSFQSFREGVLFDAMEKGEFTHEHSLALGYANRNIAWAEQMRKTDAQIRNDTLKSIANGPDTSAPNA